METDKIELGQFHVGELLKTLFQDCDIFQACRAGQRLRAGDVGRVKIIAIKPALGIGGGQEIQTIPLPAAQFKIRKTFGQCRSAIAAHQGDPGQLFRCQFRIEPVDVFDVRDVTFIPFHNHTLPFCVGPVLCQMLRGK